ncbi:glycosyltransferase domain-containing protein [Mycolicibacterium sp. ELW1]|uniref:glycosyltransferase domain-containing protein n=1 Tax=Mycobacteriaceae TaxID=1762 RepID=UPI0011EE9251|nr:glycosyltransferase domain-containing protein [Mycobacterium sp. ELW1]QEN12683.1 DUF616 domain-containing protein [Mycobacterium sp. ELW1]
MADIALYTATIGGYETPTAILPDQDSLDYPAGNIDYYRFEDASVAAAPVVGQTPSPTSPWTHIQDKERVPGDPIRSARAIKILGHPALSTYDVTVWIDNRVRLKVAVEELVERFLPAGVDVALPLHSYHQSLSEEFEAILHGRFDDPRRVREQKRTYSRTMPNLFAQPVYWTAILIRRNNAAVERFNTIWWEQVLRYSRRDQLSFPYACAATPELSVMPFPADNFESDFHEWRTFSDVGRPPGAGHWKPASLNSELFDTARFVKDGIKSAVTARRERWKVR